MDNYNLQQTDAKIQAILNKVQPVVDNNTVAGFGNGYAISTTAGATADKEVTINGFTPTIGGVFSVMFQNAFSASDPTLNVSNTGAKDLMLFGSALPAAFVPAGTILTLTYDGTNYNVIGRLNDITVKSTLESTDSPLLQDANGNFIKSTPAALASLLGAFCDCDYIKSFPPYTNDLNRAAFTDSGYPIFALTDKDTLNVPNVGTTDNYGVVLNFPCGGTQFAFGVQIWIHYTSQRTFLRIYWSSWKNWIELTNS